MADVSTQKVSTQELEVELGVEARRLWLAHLDAATTLPIASGGVVESVEYESGNGEVGSVKIVKFGPAFPFSKISREIVEAVDHEKFTTTYSVVGEELFTDHYSLYRGTISYLPLEPSKSKALEDTGGAEPGETSVPQSSDRPRTLAKWVLEYIPKDGADTPFPEFAKTGVHRVFTNLEAWLLANPELYVEKPKPQIQI